MLRPWKDTYIILALCLKRSFYGLQKLNSKVKNIDKFPWFWLNICLKNNQGPLPIIIPTYFHCASLGDREMYFYSFYLQCTLLVLGMNIWTFVSLICRFRLCLERPVFSVILLLFKGHRTLSKNLKRKCNKPHNLSVPSHLQMNLNVFFSTFLKCCSPRLKMCFRFSKSKNLANVVFWLIISQYSPSIN